MVDFRTLIMDLDAMGFMDIVLPFILVFAIVYAVLTKVKISDKDNINVIIALVMGLAFVGASVGGLYPRGMDPVSVINQSLPTIGIVLIGVVMLLIVLQLLDAPLDVKGNKGLGNFIVVASFLVVLAVFLNSTGAFTGGVQVPRWLWFIYNPAFQTILYAAVFFGLAIWAVTFTGGDPKKRKNYNIKLVKDDSAGSGKKEGKG